jgi:COMPASS component SWD3
VLAATLDGHVRLWELAGAEAGAPPRLRKTYKGHENERFCVAATFLRGRWVVAGSEDGTPVVWDTNSKKVAARLAGHTAGVLAVEGHPLWDVVATGGLRSDPTVRLWANRAADAVLPEAMGAAAGAGAGVAVAALADEDRAMGGE